MRKVLFSLLLASTMATPALAQDWRGHGDRSGRGDQARSEHSDSRQDRSSSRSESRDDRSDARQAAEARQARAEAQQARAQAQQERADARQQGVRDRGDHVAQGADAARFQDMAREVQARRDRQPNVNDRGRPTLGDRDGRDGVADWRGQRGNDARDSNWRDQRGDRDSSNWRDRRNGGVRIPVGARPDRPAPAPETAYDRNHRTPSWDRNWRNDHSRHDWRRYRDHHRSTFHLGVYFDPFGWGYQRYNVGWRLWPNYYSSNYWLNDPSMYALPYAPFPYKWVRYYDDALLVNTYTGQVVDVMYDFFW